MRTWEEFRSVGIRDARAALAVADGKERIATAFADWWRNRDQEKEDPSGRLEHRSSTMRLADELRAAGMEDAAGLAVSRWIKEGPIDPGVWVFAFLLGKSFVGPFIDALLAGRWRTPNFFGLECYGAWDAFDSSLRDRLQTEVDASDAAIRRLRLSVETVKSNPVGSMPFHERNRGHLEDRITRYLASPGIDEAWEHPFDPPIHVEDSFLWDALLSARPVDTLELLGSMRHPVFMRNCFGSERLAGRPEEVAGLIKAAPDAFNDGTIFQAAGAVALSLLEIAGAAIGRTALESDGLIRIAPLDTSELLAPTIERCQAATKTILDALFSRRDAVPLAWAWLERMISNGKLRRRWPAIGSGLAVNLPMLAIIAIAKRLCWRCDWKEWIEERKELWRIYRLMAVLAVGTFGQAADIERLASALEWALIEGDLDYAGIGDAIADGEDVVAAIGERAVCTFDDPGGWFAATWDKLRPVRERNWRVGVGGGKRNNMAELLTLWGFAAHGFLPPVERKALWASLEKSVRDAWQTDTLGYAPVWSRALVRLFGTFETDKSDGSVPVERQMAQALLPYIAADYGFLMLVDSLTKQGWPFELIRDAVAVSGFDLGCLVSQFLDMKELVFLDCRKPTEMKSADSANWRKLLLGTTWIAITAPNRRSPRRCARQITVARPPRI